MAAAAPNSNRRAPALGIRILLAGVATAATIALTGWMGRAALVGSGIASADPVTQVIHRVVVVVEQPGPDPDASLEAVPTRQAVTVVTQPAQVVSRTAAAPPAPAVTPAAATTSSGS